MAGVHATVIIDAKKLKDILKKRGLTCVELSTAFGYSASTLTRQVNNGKLSLVVANLLKTMYGIDRQDYEVKETAEISTAPNPKAVHISEVDEAALYKVIYAAVTAAVTPLVDILKDIEEELH